MYGDYAEPCILLPVELSQLERSITIFLLCNDAVYLWAS